MTPEEESVEQAAEHAARAVEQRRQMQRDAVRAQATDGEPARELQRSSEEHQAAAHDEEQAAQQRAREADDV